MGEKIGVILNQDADTIVPRGLQMIMLGMLFAGFWQGKNSGLVKVDIIKIMQNYQKGAFKVIETQILTANTIDDLSNLVRKYAQKISEVLYV